jgi:hypothetical protein
MSIYDSQKANNPFLSNQSRYEKIKAIESESDPLDGNAAQLMLGSLAKDQKSRVSANKRIKVGKSEPESDPDSHSDSDSDTGSDSDGGDLKDFIVSDEHDDDEDPDYASAGSSEYPIAIDVESVSLSYSESVYVYLSQSDEDIINYSRPSGSSSPVKRSFDEFLVIGMIPSRNIDPRDTVRFSFFNANEGDQIRLSRQASLLVDIR